MTSKIKENDLKEMNNKLESEIKVHEVEENPQNQVWRGGLIGNKMLKITQSPCH
jgi:actin-related protein